jgi:hypothetical protein
LRRLGLNVPPPIPAPELRLYQRLRESDPDGAHAQYNRLVKGLVEFERACAG